MADMILCLEGKHFRRQYLLYVIEITHGQDKYYYIGQTGDNHYKTARPAFRRLAGHLEDLGRSTQNQVYKYLAFEVLDNPRPKEKKYNFSDKIKQSVEDFLVDSEVKMYVYRLQSFESAISHEEHLGNVRNVITFEQMVIELFKARFRNIGNKKERKIPSAVKCPYPEILIQIKNDFNILN